MKNFYCLFHLNLQFSSIPIKDFKKIINNVYYPILNIIDKHNYHLSIELTGWTLEKINEIDKNWIKDFKILLSKKKCTLIGSGYSQIIGPIYDSNINFNNQKLGIEVYKKILNIKPKISLVNEMAFSNGLIEVYKKFYEAIILDIKNAEISKNIKLQNNNFPNLLINDNKDKIPVIWADTLLMQKFQQYVHGSISMNNYLKEIKSFKLINKLTNSIYCGDAEIFDYRPKRYHSEDKILSNEWSKILNLFNYLKTKDNIHFVSPELIHSNNKYSKKINLSSISNPTIVKKQQKYNISRWAISGRDDQWLNTISYRLIKIISQKKITNKKIIKDLLFILGSDLRTHVCKSKWNFAIKKINFYCKKLNLKMNFFTNNINISKFTSINKKISNNNYEIFKDDFLLYCNTKYLKCIFNLKKGLSIYSLAFKSHDFIKSIGTIKKGYFADINFANDFYSNITIIDHFDLRKKITDLDIVKPKININAKSGKIEIYSKISTKLGTLKKIYVIYLNSEKITSKIYLPKIKRNNLIARISNITFHPDFNDGMLNLYYKNGGKKLQKILINQNVNHSLNSFSNLHSCNNGILPSNGELKFVNRKKHVVLFKWKPEDLFIFPMLLNKKIVKKSLTRIFFSFLEQDDTFVSTGYLARYFEYHISSK